MRDMTKEELNYGKILLWHTYENGIAAEQC